MKYLQALLFESGTVVIEQYEDRIEVTCGESKGKGYDIHSASLDCLRVLKAVAERRVRKLEDEMEETEEQEARLAEAMQPEPLNECANQQFRNLSE